MGKTPFFPRNLTIVHPLTTLIPPLPAVPKPLTFLTAAREEPILTVKKNYINQTQLNPPISVNCVESDDSSLGSVLSSTRFPYYLCLLPILYNYKLSLFKDICLFFLSQPLTKLCKESFTTVQCYYIRV